MNDARDKSLGELFGQLARETATLVRDEVALARIEIEGKLRNAARALPALGIAAVLALGAFGALNAFVIAALALALPVWAAALIVAVVEALVAVALIGRARAALKAAGPPVPTRTTETIKEDIAWAKTRTRSGGK